jgi:DNA-binding transcriptional MerR regulator
VASEARAGLAVGEVARRVGVDASTLRSWERRYGVAPSARTAGGHRRYTTEDIAALQQIRRLVESGIATSTAAVAAQETAPTGSQRGTSAAARWVSAAENLDAHGCTRAAQQLLTQSGAMPAWTDVFAPWLRGIGERWGGTGTGVECEHVASDSAQHALILHAARQFRIITRIGLLAAAAPGEQHVLPLHALAAAVAERKIAGTVLGALPEIALQDAIAQCRPSVVAVWSQDRDTADAALVRRLTRQAPAVIAAGPGWTRRRLPDEVIAVDDYADAVATVGALAGTAA